MHLSQQHLSRIQQTCSEQFAGLARTQSAALTSASVLEIRGGMQQWQSCTSLLPDGTMLWLGAHEPHSLVLVRTHQGQVQPENVPDYSCQSWAPSSIGS